MQHQQIAHILISSGTLTLIGLALVAASGYCVRVWKN